MVSRSIPTILRLSLSTLFLISMSTSANAQEGPAAVSVHAAGLGRGRMVVSYGFDHTVKNDAASGELQKLSRVLPVVLRFGVSSNVDMIVSWRGGLLARSTDGTQRSDWGDPSLFTKITFTDSGHPFDAGVMIGFKIPSSRYLPHRLGSDAADLFFQALVARGFTGGEIRLNAGAAIIGDPLHAGSQDDMLTGSAMFVLRPANRWEIFGEVSGFTGPKEDDDKLQLRGGAGFGTGSGILTLYGNARLAGTPTDFGTAFEATGSWGIGVSMRHTITF